MAPSTAGPKRMAAIVLPRLACELATRRFGPFVGSTASVPRDRQRALRSDGTTPEPLAVLVDAESVQAKAPDRPLARATVAAVNDRALKQGVQPGQSVAEAAAYVAQLRIVPIELDEIRKALGEVAEVALGLGTTAAIELARIPATSIPAHVVYPGGAGAGPHDTVWLDVSGSARWMGGEDLLGERLRDRVAVLGHHVRVTIADGPRVAQAVARWDPRTRVVPAGQTAQALGALPVAALPLAPDERALFRKLGLRRIAELASLDRAQLASRLGERAADRIALIEGHDDWPIVPYAPTPIIVEQASFDRGIEGTEPLLFVLGGLVSRAAARLVARGETARLVRLQLDYDRAMAALAGLCEPSRTLTIELALPMGSAAQLTRAVRAKLEASTLAAPVVAIRLTLAVLGPRQNVQLDLSRHPSADPHAFAALLAELEASLGAARIGVLAWTDSHRPEAQSLLVPVPLEPTQRARPITLPMSAGLASRWPPRPTAPSEAASMASGPWECPPVPTRLLPTPYPLERLTNGAIVTLDRERYVVDRIRFEMRLDRVQWWTTTPLSRDYARLWLHTAVRTGAEPEHVEAWFYLEPGASRGYLHGWFD